MKAKANHHNIPGLNRALKTGDKPATKKDINRAIKASFDQDAFKSKSDRVELRGFLRALKSNYADFAGRDGAAGLSQAEIHHAATHGIEGTIG